MKLKHFLPFLFCIFLLSSIVNAGFIPQIVSGQISIEGMDYPEGLKVKMTNLRTHEEVFSTVDSSGFFLTDWNNHNFINGDKIDIVIPVCSQSTLCQKQITLYFWPCRM